MALSDRAVRGGHLEEGRDKLRLECCEGAAQADS